MTSLLIRRPPSRCGAVLPAHFYCRRKEAPTCAFVPTTKQHLPFCTRNLSTTHDLFGSGSKVRLPNIAGRFPQAPESPQRYSHDYSVYSLHRVHWRLVGRNAFGAGRAHRWSGISMATMTCASSCISWSDCQTRPNSNCATEKSQMSSAIESTES